VQNFMHDEQRHIHSRVNMAVTLQQSSFDGLSDFVGLRLPGTETDCGNLVTRVQGVGLPIDWKFVSEAILLHITTSRARTWYARESTFCTNGQSI
jgi:hypothetical protein